MRTIFYALLMLLPLLSTAQSIRGKISELPNTNIKLYGYNLFDSYAIDSTQTDNQGVFTLNYAGKDIGMGYLDYGQEKPFFLMLDKEPTRIEGTSLQQPNAFTIAAGKENQRLFTYAGQRAIRFKVLSAWRFLKQRYQEETILNKHTKTVSAITDEIDLLENESKAFIADLPENSFMKWYLPLRNTLGDVGYIAQYRPDIIPQTRKQLRAIDLTDERFNKSGLLYDAIFNHIWFIENSSGPLDEVFKDLNTSIDIIAEHLKGNEERFNLVMEKMFEILEERSLFTSSEYLAEKLLNSDDCGCLNPQLQKKLERYGKMAKGQTAPDINFTEFTYYPDDVSAGSLKTINADYKLVVFAAGWCPHCVEAMPKITENYKTWRDKGVEVIFVSLDTNPKDFAGFAGPLPFVSTTDFKKWDGQAVEDYQVYATPSYFLLNKDLEILLRPKSVEHANAWIEAFIK